MKKKAILILLLSILPCISMIRTASAFPSIDAYLGKNLEVQIDLPWSYHEEMTVNSSYTVLVHVFYFLDLYIKNLQLTLDVNYGKQTFNVTLIENETMNVMPTVWMGLFEREFDFTPDTTGDLKISVSTDYEYAEGNQTVEEVGMASAYRIASIILPGNSYSDISNQNQNLQYEVGNLNMSYRKLNASYQDQQRLILVLTTATAVFISTTIIALALGERRFRRLNRKSENKDWEDKKW